MPEKGEKEVKLTRDDAGIRNDSASDAAIIKSKLTPERLKEIEEAVKKHQQSLKTNKPKK